MANTYVLIASGSIGSGGASSFTFSSIPATYTDLILKQSSRIENGAYYRYQNLGFNGVGTSFTWKDLYSDGSTPGSQSASTNYGGYNPATNATASVFCNNEFYIPNYASANYKSWSGESVTENNSTTSGQFITEMGAGLWSSTAAITSITITPYSSVNLSQYSTFYLYGISKS